MHILENMFSSVFIDVVSGKKGDRTRSNASCKQEPSATRTSIIVTTDVVFEMRFPNDVESPKETDESRGLVSRVSFRFAQTQISHRTFHPRSYREMFLRSSFGRLHPL